MATEWFDGVPKELYASRKYSTRHNRYKVKSGLDQAGWESSGWINACDPRGWTQWYFRFYMGRRLPDGEDERQIGRWNGVAGKKGRWKNNLAAKCLMQGSSYDDESVSPVVRQTLLHWAYELNEHDFNEAAAAELLLQYRYSQGSNAMLTKAGSRRCASPPGVEARQAARRDVRASRPARRCDQGRRRRHGWRWRGERRRGCVGGEGEEAERGQGEGRAGGPPVAAGRRAAAARDQEAALALIMGWPETAMRR